MPLRPRSLCLYVQYICSCNKYEGIYVSCRLLFTFARKSLRLGIMAWTRTSKYRLQPPAQTLYITFPVQNQINTSEMFSRMLMVRWVHRVSCEKRYALPNWQEEHAVQVHCTYIVNSWYYEIMILYWIDANQANESFYIYSTKQTLHDRYCKSVHISCLLNYKKKLNGAKLTDSPKPYRRINW